VKRTLWLAAWFAAASASPWLTGPGEAPSLAPSAAELLPPGALVVEVGLRDGGFVRARSLAFEAGALVVTGASGSRSISGVDTAGPLRTRVMWLGTDQQGRDVLARLAAGARRSLAVAALALVVAAVLGLTIGLAAAFAPAAIADVVALIVDAALSLPRLLVILILGVAFRASWSGAALAIGCASWMELARLVEADARSLSRRPFALAARAAGAGPTRVAATHIVPNLAPVLASVIPAAATDAILLESTLSFLGVGGADATSWGRMIADGMRLMPGAWWMSVAPGVLLAATAVAVSALARGGRREAPFA
jgi:peptide/nickel transport system permease protein